MSATVGAGTENNALTTEEKGNRTCQQGSAILSIILTTNEVSDRSCFGFVDPK